MEKRLFFKPVSEIFTSSEIDAVYLFGSQAVNRQNAESDYDIAIFVHDKRKIATTKLLKKVIAACKYPEKLHITIVDQYNTSPFLLYQIIKNGRLVYEKKEQIHVELEALILRLYFDDSYRNAIFFSYLEKKYAH